MHHLPENDAPAADWHTYLRGTGHLSDQEPQPFANYYSFHGYWVPPRIGPGPERPKKAPPRKRKPVHGVEPAWFSFDNLMLLHLHHRDEFEAIRARLADVERVVDEGTPKERVAARRTQLGLAVESGTMNQATADQQLAAFAVELGVELH